MTATAAMTLVRPTSAPSLAARRAPLASADDRLAWGGLMVRARQGDRAAYRQLLREITPLVRSLVARRHRDAGEVDDVVQDILLSVHRVRHTYDPGRPFVNWLMTIVRCRSIDALRRRHRSGAAELGVEGIDAIADPLAASLVTAIEDRSALVDAIDRLPPNQREAVELLTLRQLSLTEAAAQADKTVGALKVSLHRALRALRHSLQPAVTDRDAPMGSPAS